MSLEAWWTSEEVYDWREGAEISPGPRGRGRGGGLQLRAFFPAEGPLL